MFIQTEATPNPETLKFLPGKPVMDEGVVDYTDADGAAGSPLARRLFAVDGVTGVFLGSDFISVSKDATPWPHLKPAVLGAIMEHYLSGDPVLEDGASAEATADGEEDYLEEDAGTVAMIKEILDERVRPAVAGDGGDIIFRSYRDGIVSLAMRGACAGCPSSTMTLQMGIQNLLKHFVPEVREVRPVA
ncbi:NifU family protein [Acuticoccus sp. I52.16.1]|uniref:NifU family protein n=1 Tax=Acuticoccus sp. I52.16.1 TaxID=2928472 RepID=UPI001FD12D73|nr:NifU family protein [Acuticoccus sp. I52.16.1]UOM33583.1 NifU family protein [Acuticoccus sp. I52.16.1]